MSFLSASNQRYSRATNHDFLRQSSPFRFWSFHVLTNCGLGKALSEVPSARVSTGFFGLRYHKRLFPNSSWACIASILRIFCAMAAKHVAIIWPDNMHLKCTSYFPIKSSALGTSSSGHDIVQQPMPTRLTESTTPILEPRKGEGGCLLDHAKSWRFVCVSIYIYIQTDLSQYVY